MEPLVDADVFRQYLGNPDEVEGWDDARATLFLRAASDEVRRYTNRRSFTGTAVEADVDGTGTDVVLLDGTPVVDVVSVAAGAPTAPDDRTELVEGTDYEWSADGLIVSLVGPWPRRFRWLHVVWSFGWQELPETIIGTVCRVAARGFVNPEGLVAETAPGYSPTYGPGSDRLAFLTDGDRRALAGYRL